MIEIPDTSPCYLTTNQSEEYPQAGQAHHNPYNVAFKILSLKAPSPHQ